MITHENKAVPSQISFWQSSQLFTSMGIYSANNGAQVQVSGPWFEIVLSTTALKVDNELSTGSVDCECSRGPGKFHDNWVTSCADEGHVIQSKASEHASKWTLTAAVSDVKHELSNATKHTFWCTFRPWKWASPWCCFSLGTMIVNTIHLIALTRGGPTGRMTLPSL